MSKGARTEAGRERRTSASFSISAIRIIAASSSICASSAGASRKGDALRFVAAEADFTALEVGILSPEEKPCDEIAEGEIGYIVTGIKKPGIASVGETVTTCAIRRPPCTAINRRRRSFGRSVYPNHKMIFSVLRLSLDRLRLSDSSLSYEEESSGVMGKGFRCGFLGHAPS